MYTRLDFLSVDQAIKFFERCEKEKAVTLEARMKILRRMEHDVVVVEAAPEDVKAALNKGFKTNA